MSRSSQSQYFKKKFSCLASSQITMGILMMLDQGVVTFFSSESDNVVDSYIAPGIWVGFMIVLTGGIGSGASNRNSREWVRAYMALNILTVLLFIPTFIILVSLYTAIYYYRDNFAYSFYSSYFDFDGSYRLSIVVFSLKMGNLAMAFLLSLLTIAAAGHGCHVICCPSSVSDDSLMIHATESSQQYPGAFAMHAYPQPHGQGFPPTPYQHLQQLTTQGYPPHAGHGSLPPSVHGYHQPPGQSLLQPSAHGFVQHCCHCSLHTSAQCCLQPSGQGPLQRSVEGAPLPIGQDLHQLPGQGYSQHTPLPQYHRATTQLSGMPEQLPPHYHRTTTQLGVTPEPMPPQYHRTTTQLGVIPEPMPPQHHTAATQSSVIPEPMPTQYQRTATQLSVIPEPRPSQAQTGTDVLNEPDRLNPLPNQELEEKIESW